MKSNCFLHPLPLIASSARRTSRPALLLVWLAAAVVIVPKVGAANWDISITADGFNPSYLEVAAGDTVTWWNDDYDFGDSHSTHSYSYPWNSGPIPVGHGVYFSPTRTGSFDYTDDFGFAGDGTLVVKPAGPPPPPGNDQCSGAYYLSEASTFTEDTTSATSTGDPAISCAPSGKGVWFSYTPTENGLVTVSTCGSSFGTVLAVYTGPCGALTPVVCGDQNGPACIDSTASVAFQGLANTTYLILAAGNSSASGNLSIVASNDPSAALAWQEAWVTFDLGPSIAQPNTNLLHIVDSTNDRLLTLNTDTGSFVSSLRLCGKLSSLGLMCFSVDGQTLYVPLANTNKLQVISLATLTTSDLVPLTVSPTSLAAGSDGFLYALVNGQLTKLDPATGQILGSTGSSYYGPILKANVSGTRLYIVETGLSGGAWAVDEYAVVASALPAHVASHYSTKSNDKDLVIAEDIGWLYLASGGAYGVGAWNMNTATYSFWPFGSAYGVAVAMVPGDTVVYGASGDYYDPRIVAFDRTTGAVSNTFIINAAGRGTGSVNDRSLKVTPNGHIFYERSGRKLGLIGTTMLVTNTPTTSEIVDAGTNRTVLTGDLLTLNATTPDASGADTFTWTKLAGPGTVNFSAPNALSTTAQISTPGNYTLQIERANSSGWLSQDRVYVTVNSRPILLEQGGLNGGRFQMRLSAAPGNYQIQVSSNLVNWVVLTNVANTTGQITIADPGTGFTRRFYKASTN